MAVVETVPNSFAMDGAITPLYSSAFDPFDEESQLTASNHLTQTSEILKPMNTEFSSSRSILDLETGERLLDDLDLCQYFEDVPLNMEEFNEQYTYNDILGALVDNQSPSKDVCDFFNPSEDAVRRTDLQLELNSGIIGIQEEISTPAIIQMLLDGTDNATNQLTDAVPDVAIEHLPVVLDSIDDKEEFKWKSREESGEDLRRIRNNEASRKSRQNRRQRLSAQLSMLSDLEEQHQQLSVKVKQLEQLKSEMMKYLKK